MVLTSNAQPIPLAALEHLDLDDLLPQQSRIIVPSRTPRINAPTAPHHSRHASVQSYISGSTQVEDDDDREDWNGDASLYSRSSTPASIANTFGGIRRDSQRRWPDDPSSSKQRPLTTRTYSSESLNSQSSASSSVTSFAPSASASHYPQRWSLPARGSSARQYLKASEQDLHDVPRVDTADTSGIRTEDTVKGRSPAGRGVTDFTDERFKGAQREQSKRKLWFRRRSRRKRMSTGAWSGKEEDRAMELWTVDEETKISPIKGIWNRSRARFGASTPALLSNPPAQLSKNGHGKRFASSSSLRQSGGSSSMRRGNEPSLVPDPLPPDAMRQTTLSTGTSTIPSGARAHAPDAPAESPSWTSPPHSPHLLDVPRFSSTRRSSASMGLIRQYAASQPRSPPPRSASLPMQSEVGDPSRGRRGQVDVRAASGTTQGGDVSLSWVGNVGCDDERSMNSTRKTGDSGGNYGRGDPDPYGLEQGNVVIIAQSDTVRIERRLAEANPNPDKQPSADSTTSRTKRRWTSFFRKLRIGEASSGGSSSGRPDMSPRKGDFGEQRSQPLLNDARSKLRPVSMVPLASEHAISSNRAEDNHWTGPTLRRSHSANIRMFMSKLGRRSSRIDNKPIENGDMEEEELPTQRIELEGDAADKKRRSSPATLQIPGNRWSLSQSNMLQFKNPDAFETLDDLLARLREISIPDRMDSPDARGQGDEFDRSEVLAATQSKLSGDHQPDARNLNTGATGTRTRAIIMLDSADTTPDPSGREAVVHDTSAQHFTNDELSSSPPPVLGRPLATATAHSRPTAVFACGVHSRSASASQIAA